jgi:menaquinone-dependent protoporphyrinogen oxidase
VEDHEDAVRAPGIAIPPAPTPDSTRPAVLVAYATKMGGTAGIADMIADELRLRGLSAVARPASDVGDISGYEIVVLGSALYMRRWRSDAVRFLRRHRRTLRERTLLLFQSGPCGRDAAEPDQPEPANVRRLREALDADAPVTFGGRLDPVHAVGFIARRMAVGELAGDYRDEESIRRWAADIAACSASAPWQIER